MQLSWVTERGSRDTTHVGELLLVAFETPEVLVVNPSFLEKQRQLHCRCKFANNNLIKRIEAWRVSEILFQIFKLNKGTIKNLGSSIGEMPNHLIKTPFQPWLSKRS